MQIRKAIYQDIPLILEIFAVGRQIQREVSGIRQWADGYPGPEMVEEDIQQGFAYVCVDDSDLPVAYFCLQTGIDPYYQEIAGEWLNDGPYVTIHRVASNGQIKGAGRYCLTWVLDHYSNVRIDTHQDNIPMTKLIESLPFSFCGVVTVADGTQRNAYQFIQ
ncbi:N-acetyltransferase [Hutsoniella sourekii]